MSRRVDVLSGVELKRWLRTVKVNVKLRCWMRETGQFSERAISCVEWDIRRVGVNNEGMIKDRFFGA